MKLSIGYLERNENIINCFNYYTYLQVYFCIFVILETCAINCAFLWNHPFFTWTLCQNIWPTTRPDYGHMPLKLDETSFVSFLLPPKGERVSKSLLYLHSWIYIIKLGILLCKIWFLIWWFWVQYFNEISKRSSDTVHGAILTGLTLLKVLQSAVSLIYSNKGSVW